MLPSMDPLFVLFLSLLSVSADSPQWNHLQKKTITKLGTITTKHIINIISVGKDNCATASVDTSMVDTNKYSTVSSISTK